MEMDVKLQLEALKLLQQWSIWLISLSTGLIGLFAVANRDYVNTRAFTPAKYCVIFLIISICFAVFLVGAIPAQVQKIGASIQDNPVLFGNARGIYGGLYLDFVPLWLLVGGQRISFFLALCFAARVFWVRHLTMEEQ